MKSARRLLHRQCAQSELSCYLDGELSDRRAARVAAHVRACEECAQELGTLQATVTMLRATPVPGMPRAVVIPASAIAAQRQTRRVDHTFASLRASAIAVTVILAVLLSRNAFGTLGRPANQVVMDTALVESAPESVALLQAAPQVEAGSTAEAVVAGAAPAEAVSAREAPPEGTGAGETQPEAAPAALSAELDAEGEASTEAAPEVSRLAAEPLAEEQLPGTEAARMPLAKAAPQSPLPREVPAFWTPLRIASATLASILIALIAALLAVGRQRLAL